MFYCKEDTEDGIICLFSIALDLSSLKKAEVWFPVRQSVGSSIEAQKVRDLAPGKY